MLNLDWGSWTGPIWNSKWTSESVPIGKHRHGLGLSKQWEVRAPSAWRIVWLYSRIVSPHTPDLQICPSHFSSMAVIGLLILPGAVSEPKHSQNFRFQLFAFFLWQHLLRLWHVLLKFWFSFLPRRNHTVPSAGLADYHSQLALASLSLKLSEASAAAQIFNPFLVSWKSHSCSKIAQVPSC